jgi:hypothetical protein
LKAFWDKVGIFLSGFCAIHCLLFPVAIALFPLWLVAESAHGWTHPILFLLIVPTVYFAVRADDVPVRVFLFLFAGITIVGLSWILHGWVSLWTESAITTLGSIFLVTGHWFNYKNHMARACFIPQKLNLK